MNVTAYVCYLIAVLLIEYKDLYAWMYCIYYIYDSDRTNKIQ